MRKAERKQIGGVHTEDTVQVNRDDVDPVQCPQSSVAFGPGVGVPSCTEIPTYEKI